MSSARTYPSIARFSILSRGGVHSAAANRILKSSLVVVGRKLLDATATAAAAAVQLLCTSSRKQSKATMKLSNRYEPSSVQRACHGGLPVPWSLLLRLLLLLAAAIVAIVVMHTRARTR